PEQKPLWDKLNSIVQAATDRERQLCSAVPNADQGGQETILDRVNRREQFLSARLQALLQAKPALEALYQSLSPDQKAIINHPFRRGEPRSFKARRVSSTPEFPPRSAAPLPAVRNNKSSARRLAPVDTEFASEGQKREPTFVSAPPSRLRGVVSRPCRAPARL